MRRCGAFHRLGARAAANYGLGVEEKFQSELVKLLMPDATEAEIEEATLRWVIVLQVLNRIAERQAMQSGDSPPDGTNDRFESL